MSVTVEIDLSGLERMLSPASVAAAQLALSEAVKADCEPFVPMRSGQLRETAVPGPDAVVYPQPYAYYVYNGIAGKHRARHWAVGGPHWAEKAKGAHLGEWEELVAAAIVGGS